MWAIVVSVMVALASGTLVMVAGALILERMRLSRSWVLRKRLSDVLEGSRPSEERGEAQIVRLVDDRRSVVERLRAVNTLLAELASDAQHAGLRWSSDEIGRHLATGLAVGVALGLVGHAPWWFTLFLGTGTAMAPVGYIRFARMRRDQLVEAQMPDALDMLVSALQAGLSLQAGLHFVGHELPAPVGPELARVHDEHRLGVDMRQALLGFQERLGSVDARMVVMAILIQHETGGNLTEVLTNIATVIRERIRFRDQLGVLTAESKASAYLLSVIPVVLFALIQASNPDYTRVLWETQTGNLLLLYGLMSLVIGIMLMRRFSRVES